MKQDVKRARLAVTLNVDNLKMHFLNLNRNKFNPNVLSFHGDRGSENSTEITKYLAQCEADGARAVFEGFPRDAHLKTNTFVFNDDTIVDGNGCLFECANQTENQELDAACFAAGSLHSNDVENQRLTFHPLPALARGTDKILQTVFTTTPGELLLIVEASDGFGSTHGQPVFAQAVMVTDDQGNLSHGLKRGIDAATGAIGTDPAGAWVARVSKGNSEPLGNLLVAPHMVRRPTLINVRVMNHDGPWMNRTGVFQGHFENIEVVQSTVVMMANALADCVVKNVSGVFENRGYEFAWLSQETVVSDFTLTHRTTGAVNHEVPVRTGEGSHGMVVKDGVVHMGNAILDPGKNTLVKTSKSDGDTFRNITFHGNPHFYTAFAQGEETFDTTFDGLKFKCGVPDGGFWVNLNGENARMMNNYFEGTGVNKNIILNSEQANGVAFNNVWESDGTLRNNSNTGFTAYGNVNLTV